uniref:Uncharacterized protein n=1 Tax=Anopheles epiroticus TaxID=199890 RepID=A0A182P6K1_9DIPT
MSTSVEEVDEQVLEIETQSTTSTTSTVIDNSSVNNNGTTNNHSRAQKSYKNLHEFSAFPK